MVSLTCPSLDELRPLVRPAECRHPDLIQPAGCQRGEPVVSRLAGQSHGRENPRVVKEQCDLERSGMNVEVQETGSVITSLFMDFT